MKVTLIAGLLVATLAGPVRAETIAVVSGDSIQAAITAATDGDVIEVAAGTYVEDLDFVGKAITVRGVGPATVVRGTGTGSVVTFASGEGPDSVLDSLTVTGGSAPTGGGVQVVDASPTIVRTVVWGNRALISGSGIHLERSSARLVNNLIAYNRRIDPATADPHTVQVINSAALVLNNTIVRGDSNGLITLGNSPATIMNNIFLANGGRGICDFSAGGGARVHYNVFHRNRRAALLTGGIDFRRIARAEEMFGAPRLIGNVDGNPRLVRSPRRGVPVMLNVPLFAPSLSRGGTAIDAGNPDPAYDDLDGTRNDAGFTGGPEA